jgi:hypothetical protein
MRKAETEEVVILPLSFAKRLSKYKCKQQQSLLDHSSPEN